MCFLGQVGEAMLSRDPERLQHVLGEAHKVQGRLVRVFSKGTVLIVFHSE